MTQGETTLATQAYRRLRQELLGGRLAPGLKLKVQNIAADYGVGSSPIREALSSLAAEGLVERLDQRGFRVAAANLADFDELVRARCRLEEIVLRESINAGDAVWEEGVVLANYRLGRLDRASSDQAEQMWNDAYSAWHDALLSACSSPTLLGFCASLGEKAARYRNLAAVAKGARPVAIDHEAITQAALARRTEEACRLLVDHYLAAAEQVREDLGLGAESRTAAAPAG